MSGGDSCRIVGMSARRCSTGTASYSSPDDADMPNAEGPAGGWQLPQGGIDPEEDPRTAVLRELAEEIGTDRAEIIGEHPDVADLRPAAASGRRGTRGALPRPEAALVRTAFHRRGQRHQAGCRPGPRIRCLALGRPGRTAGAGGGLQAADLPDTGRHHSPVLPRRSASSSACRCSSMRLSFARSALVRPWRMRFCFARAAASSRPRRCLSRWRLTISPMTASCTSSTGHNGEEPMGSTINLKAADGFTLSAYTAGPTGGDQGDRGDPGDLRRQPSHARHGRPVRGRRLRGLRAGAVRPRRDAAWNWATRRRTSTRAAATG